MAEGETESRSGRAKIGLEIGNDNKETEAATTYVRLRVTGYVTYVTVYRYTEIRISKNVKLWRASASLTNVRHSDSDSLPTVLKKKTKKKKGCP